jgi:transcriptional regulator with XRE-family HTH domain
MNINSSLVAELREKTYRDAYVESQIRMTLPLQIRELRKSREWTQPELAERARMAQPRISELEKPGERRLTIETLLRLASAFDVGLQVRFVPISELVDWSEALDLDNFAVQPFDAEVTDAERAAVLGCPRRPPASVRTAAAGANQGAGGGSVGRRLQVAETPSNALFPGGGQSGINGNLAVARTSLL